MQSGQHVYGALVLSATTPVDPFPVHVNAKTVTGTHTENKWRGRYHLLIEGESAHSVLALPQRNKYTTIKLLSANLLEAAYLAEDLKNLMTDLDSRYEGARFLYKLNQTMKDLRSDWNQVPPYLAILENQSEHSYFALLSHQVSTHIIGVYDGVNSSVRLVWTTDPDFIQGVRKTEPTRYVFFRYPDLVDRPMFLNTQLLCARWFQWSRAFDQTTDGLLRTFNALETLLFKDPTVSTGS